jgi:hypothetical protein
MLLLSHLLSRGHHVIVRANRFEMLAAATELLGFQIVGQLLVIPGALGFTHQVEDRAVVLQNGPIGIVFAQRGVNQEPSGQFHEELDVFALVEFLGKLALQLGIIDHGAREEIPCPRDVLRHTAASHLLVPHGARAAVDMPGHSEMILFRQYRELVRPEKDKAFWEIIP